MYNGDGWNSTGQTVEFTQISLCNWNSNRSFLGGWNSFGIAASRSRNGENKEEELNPGSIGLLSLTHSLTILMEIELNLVIYSYIELNGVEWNWLGLNRVGCNHWLSLNLIIHFLCCCWFGSSWNNYESRDHHCSPVQTFALNYVEWNQKKKKKKKKRAVFFLSYLSSPHRNGACIPAVSSLHHLFNFHVCNHFCFCLDCFVLERKRMKWKENEWWLWYSMWVDVDLGLVALCFPFLTFLIRTEGKLRRTSIGLRSNSTRVSSLQSGGRLRSMRSHIIRLNSFVSYYEANVGGSSIGSHWLVRIGRRNATESTLCNVEQKRQFDGDESMNFLTELETILPYHLPSTLPPSLPTSLPTSPSLLVDPSYCLH